LKDSIGTRILAPVSRFSSINDLVAIERGYNTTRVIKKSKTIGIFKTYGGNVKGKSIH
jgi:hypothetical protein